MSYYEGRRGRDIEFHLNFEILEKDSVREMGKRCQTFLISSGVTIDDQGKKRSGKQFETSSQTVEELLGVSLRVARRGVHGSLREETAGKTLARDSWK